jgi:hypothetical protein
MANAAACSRVIETLAMAPVSSSATSSSMTITTRSSASS